MITVLPVTMSVRNLHVILISVPKSMMYHSSGASPLDFFRPCLLQLCTV